MFPLIVMGTIFAEIIMVGTQIGVGEINKKKTMKLSDDTAEKEKDIALFNSEQKAVKLYMA